MKKWIKLIAIAVAVTAVILGINEFFFSAPTPPPGPPPAPAPAPIAEAAATPAAIIPVIPKATPTPKPKLSILGNNTTVTQNNKIPPRPPSALKPNQKNALAANTGGGSGSGGSGGGSSGGGSSGGGSGGGASGAGSPVEEEITETTTEQTGYWLTPDGRRHNTGCRLFGNQNGSFCQPTEGEPCPICGG